ncbi:hypothetical protein A2318_02915 [Candidatus Uhrbacteria bacterium RIFOXYB2_FULL_45_11]|uniref:Uncharacterized protein n=1 Tax=Candidatus Uhrbacteria bacterium RIFOXYB2_FULL_45_11 TaxID=1802421 RepID=A0A1F7W1E6_9BACT|nr:MAG: hypothetical protein A2318_02915 [Candidatus Uhrbacteria bacterium RIFOXYB2_FULL_45_11]
MVKPSDPNFETISNSGEKADLLIDKVANKKLVVLANRTCIVCQGWMNAQEVTCYKHIELLALTG